MAGEIRSIYIAAPWSKRELVYAYNEEIEEIGRLTGFGFIAAAQWPNEEDSPSYALGGISDESAAALALAYTHQIMQCDMVVALSADGALKPGGGRHWELGFAMAVGKAAAFVGKPEHLFHALPTLMKFRTWTDFRQWLKDGAVPQGEAAITPFPIGEDVCVGCTN